MRNLRRATVTAYISTWPPGRIRKFLQKVYAQTGLPDPQIYTWSHAKLKETVVNVFITAHKTGKFPWEEN